MATTLSASAATKTRLINRDLSKATNLLNNFTKTSSPNMTRAFKNISPIGIVSSLRARIKSPWLIDQGQSSLCGPASFFYSLAKDAPQLYVKCVLDLYINGETSLNKLKIKPSNDCKNASLTNTSGMDKVDWIALASLRDSANSTFDYQSPSDTVSGITLPNHLEKWFRAAGYQHVTNSTNLFFNKGIDNLQAAQKAFNANKNVCLFITAKSLSGSAPISVPDHWVVLSRNMLATGSGKVFSTAKEDDIEEFPIAVKVFTWGYEAYEINPKKTTTEDFCDFYFGYVSAS